MARGPAGSISDAGGEDWVAAYNAVMARGPAETGKKPGPGCCSVCCTGFSIFAALFLFILASLMKNDYPYLHIEGDMGAMSKGVVYAGLIYLVFAGIAMVCWIRGVMRVRATDGFTPVQ